jgi:hypothetical protein
MNFKALLSFMSLLPRSILALFAVALWSLALPAQAQTTNCSAATAQGATGPANWQTYCWINFSSYNDTTARSTTGQNFSLSLQDGTILAFNMKVTGGGTLGAFASPSWSGAAIGNTAMTGIAGSPVLYQTVNATTATATISNITLTPPSGAAGITSYMVILADGESTNSGESMTFTTNGGAWQLMDQAGPISGADYPTVSGTGTSNVTFTSNFGGNVGAYMMGSTSPTTVSAQLVSGGLQGFMVALRYASVRLSMQVGRSRVNAADQFTYAILATANSAVLSSGTSTGTGLGPFASTGLSTTASVPLTLRETMAAGSSSAITKYQNLLTCTNGASGSPTALPTNVATTSYNLPSLAYGDLLLCTYTSTPFPHFTLSKALGTGGRRFNTDQFTMNIQQNGTVLATTTTTGTTTTITNGTTAQTQVSAGSAYQMVEAAAGTTQLVQYTAAMACTNLWAGSTTTLSTVAGGTITPQLGDIITCTITNTRRATNATLTVVKSSSVISDPVNGTTNPKFIPGAIINYSFTVANTGTSTVDNNTVVLIDALPSQISVGSAASPSFVQGSPTSGLTFTAANDIRYSNSSTAPTSFAACTYTPTLTYDPAVRYVCLNPKGTMAGSTGTAPSFSLSMQAKVN